MPTILLLLCLCAGVGIGGKARATARELAKQGSVCATPANRWMALN